MMYECIPSHRSVSRLATLISYNMYSMTFQPPSLSNSPHRRMVSPSVRISPSTAHPRFAPVTYAMGAACARDIGAVKYLEASSKT